MEERIIAALIGQGEVTGFTSAAILALNYSHDARAIHQLQVALQQTVPGALCVAGELLSSTSSLISVWIEANSVIDHSFSALLPTALATARRILRQPQAELAEAMTAASLLSEYGTKDDIKTLSTAIEHAQKTNRTIYRGLILSIFYGPPKTLAIWRVVINDLALADVEYGVNNCRYCDFAAWELQRLTKTDFGMNGSMAQLTLAQRNHAVAQAKVWLAKQP